MGCLPNDAVHVWVGPHGEVGMHHDAAIIAWRALQAAAVRHYLHPVKPSRFPPAAGYYRYLLVTLGYWMLLLLTASYYTLCNVRGST